MNSLGNLATRQITAIRNDVEAYCADPQHMSPKRSNINAAFSTLLKTIEDYEGMAKRELVIAKREKALARATDLRAETKSLRGKFAGQDLEYVDQLTQTMDISSPSSVTPMTYNTAPPLPAQTYARPTLSAHYMMQNGTTPSQSYGSASASDPLAAYKMPSVNAPSESELPYTMRENHALREHSFIQNTETQLDAFISQGRSVLGNLVEQRGILKGTRRRLLDAANTVGLSRELIGFIDRIGAQDRVIFAVGSVFTLFAFYMIYRWFG
ncbi:protein transport protein bos1 [Malassezia yamatoensis]|uniref:Protein transport protein BOS1 n=1 Tax=Malassezia yamatoensis TaxID=253288 RepID=A0AAJ5YNT4_9BASI|nr:protein transport protein bos1 [Malassezia yamatoensis]